MPDFKPVGDALRAMYPKLSAPPDFKAAEKKIIITVSGPESLLIATQIWKAFGETAASLMEHYPRNVVSLSSDVEGK